MTAQQQLTELNAAIVEHCGPGTDPLNAIKASRMAFVLIRNHGRAIAELIEACKEFVDDQELMSHARIAAALRKLTQDA